METSTKLSFTHKWTLKNLEFELISGKSWLGMACQWCVCKHKRGRVIGSKRLSYRHEGLPSSCISFRTSENKRFVNVCVGCGPSSACFVVWRSFRFHAYLLNNIVLNLCHSIYSEFEFECDWSSVPSVAESALSSILLEYFFDYCIIFINISIHFYHHFEKYFYFITIFKTLNKWNLKIWFIFFQSFKPYVQ